jgi:hypothetical protein
MMEHRVKLFTFREVIRTEMPETHRALSQLKALADEFLHPIFIGLFFSIMPKVQWSIDIFCYSVVNCD